MNNKWTVQLMHTETDVIRGDRVCHWKPGNVCSAAIVISGHRNNERVVCCFRLNGWCTQRGVWMTCVMRAGDALGVLTFTSLPVRFDLHTLKKPNGSSWGVCALERPVSVGDSFTTYSGWWGVVRGVALVV